MAHLQKHGINSICPESTLIPRFLNYIYIYIYIYAFSRRFIQSNLQCNQAIHFLSATIPFFPNRLDTENWGSADTDPIRYQCSVFFLNQCVYFNFFINVHFLYFSVLTWSSLFCVLNTMFLNWWVKSSGYAAQKWVARLFLVGRGLYTAK